tara:strand:- start:418 stop:2298 length:1881 start_codon:yes stop_codon:yes gene_type:complete
MFDIQLSRLKKYRKIPKKNWRSFCKYRVGMVNRGNKDPVLAQQYREWAKNDPLWYINTFGFTFDPRRTDDRTVAMCTYPFQDELIIDVINAFGKEDLLVEKSRDMGASWCVLFAMEWAWKFYDGMQFLVCSRTQEYVDKVGDPKSLMWKLDAIHKFQPAWMLAKGQEVIHQGKKYKGRKVNQLENLGTGSVISGEATSANMGRGSRQTAVLLDEFAAVECGAAVNTAMTDATPCRIFVSTPQGTGNEFFRVRHDDRLRVKVKTLHWTQHPEKAKGLYIGDKDTKEVTILDKDYKFPGDYRFICDGKHRSPWYDNEWRRRSRWNLAQEVDINYQGAGKQFFDAELLLNIRNLCQPAKYQGEVLYEYELSRDAIRYSALASGRLKMWCQLDQNNQPHPHPYVIGCDVATGKGGEMSTNSTAMIYNMRTGSKVGSFATPNTEPRDFAKYVMALGYFFHGDYYPAKLIWEANGPGEQMSSAINDAEYPNIYYREEGDENRNPNGRLTPGWWTTAATKRVLLSDYADMLTEGQVFNPELEAVDEMGEYVFGSTGSPEHGRSRKQTTDTSGAKDNHGDRVIGDALASRCVKLFSGGRMPDPKAQAAEAPYGSIAYLRAYQKELEQVESSWGY